MQNEQILDLRGEVYRLKRRLKLLFHILANKFYHLVVHIWKSTRRKKCPAKWVADGQVTNRNSWQSQNQTGQGGKTVKYLLSYLEKSFLPSFYLVQIVKGLWHRKKSTKSEKCGQNTVLVYGGINIIYPESQAFLLWSFRLTGPGGMWPPWCLAIHRKQFPFTHQSSHSWWQEGKTKTRYAWSAALNRVSEISHGVSEL